MAFDEELAVAEQAARTAGAVMDHYQENGFSTERKGGYTDIVTEADHEAQEEVVETLGEVFPSDGFIGEENELRDDSEDRTWIIDPIDGTTNFAHGFPYYCSSVALQVDGEIQVGAVYWPEQDELFSAVRGEGAFLNGNPITVSEIDDIRDALTVARISSWDRADGAMKETEADILEDLVGTPAAFRRPGAAALDLCNIAAGRFDGMAIVSLSIWDIAAGALIVEEAGGAVRIEETRIAGLDGITGSLEIVASNGEIHDELEEVFDRHVRG